MTKAQKVEFVSIVLNIVLALIYTSSTFVFLMAGYTISTILMAIATLLVTITLIMRCYVAVKRGE